MDLSVVVPTLNGREQLGDCLDALSRHASDAEVVVVNGPSADGTTGMVRDRGDVDVLIEISDRNVNVARNAGIEAATGTVVAFVNYDRVVEATWADAVEDAIGDDADVVTGPTHRTLRAGMTTDEKEARTIAGRQVTYFNGDNVAFSRASLDALDGFDEFLPVGGARDAAHRLAGLEYGVNWHGEMCVQCEYRTDGGRDPDEYGEKYRALTYRLFKNYGVRPTVVRRTASHAGSDALSGAVDVVRGERAPTEWFNTGLRVTRGIARGVKDGVVARARDRDETRNPHGVSVRGDRAVRKYDWR